MLDNKILFEYKSKKNPQKYKFMLDNIPFNNFPYSHSLNTN